MRATLPAGSWGVQVMNERLKSIATVALLSPLVSGQDHRSGRGSPAAGSARGAIGRRSGTMRPMGKISEVRPFALGAGGRNVTIVRVRTEDGLEGIGEGTINYRVRAIH